MTPEKFEEFKTYTLEEIKDYLDARVMESILRNVEPLPTRRFLTFLKLLEFRINKHLLGDIQGMQVKGNSNLHKMTSYNPDNISRISKHLETLKVSYTIESDGSLVYDKTTIDNALMFYTAFKHLNHTDVNLNSFTLNLNIAKFSTALNNFLDLKHIAS